MVVASSCLDIVLRKVSQSSNQSVNIAAVSVVGADGTKLWSSSGVYPDTENIAAFDLQQEIAEDDIRIIIEEDEQQLFSVEDGGFVISEDILSKINYVNVVDARKFFTENESTSVLQMKLWYAIPVNNLNVYVLNDIHVYSNDLLLPLMCLVLVAFMKSMEH